MKPNEVLKHLRSIEILAALPNRDLDVLAPAIVWRSVKPGQEIVSHLSTGSEVYFVVEGAFRVSLTASDGRVVAIRQLTSGSHFGEISALTGAPRTVSVAAETKGLLAACPAGAFLNLMRGNAAFSEKIASALARNVVLLTDRVFELAVLQSRFRIYAELLRHAGRGEPTPRGILVRNAPTHAMIAAAVGAQREAVTRELRQLVTEQIIEQSKRELLICDIERLKALVRARAGPTTSQALDWRFGF